MDVKLLYSKHYGRFKRNSLIESYLWGSLIGFLASSAASLLFWYFDVKAFWLSVPVFVVVMLVAGYILSITKYEPQAEYMARKLDGFGLEQRLITMTELENDTSYIASLQRQDARKSAETVNGKLIKFAVSVPLVLGMGLTLLLSGGMTTVNALTSQGVIRSGKQIVADANAVPVVYCNVNYVINGAGYVMGEDAQVMLKGESASAVYAVADYGFVFSHWSDGNTNPYRQDFNIEDDVVLTAIFKPLSNVNERDQIKDGGGAYKPNENGLGAVDEQRRPGHSDPEDSPDKTPEDYKDQGGFASDSAGDIYLDGQTDYGGNNYTGALNDAAESAPSYGDTGKEIIGDYFDSIKK